jgi:hypothetical protein
MTEHEDILDAYTFRQPVAPVPRTESEDIPPEIQAALEAAIAHDNGAKEGVWVKQK